MQCLAQASRMAQDGKWVWKEWGSWDEHDQAWWDAYNSFRPADPPAPKADAVLVEEVRSGQPPAEAPPGPAAPGHGANAQPAEPKDPPPMQMNAKWPPTPRWPEGPPPRSTGPRKPTPLLPPVPRGSVGTGTVPVKAMPLQPPPNAPPGGGTQGVSTHACIHLQPLSGTWMTCFLYIPPMFPPPAAPPGPRADPPPEEPAELRPPLIQRPPGPGLRLQSAAPDGVPWCGPCIRMSPAGAAAEVGSREPQ